MYTYVTLTGALVELVRVSLIFPVPVAAASVIPETKALDQVITVLPEAATVGLVAV